MRDSVCVPLDEESPPFSVAHVSAIALNNSEHNNGDNRSTAHRATARVVRPSARRSTSHRCSPPLMRTACRGVLQAREERKHALENCAPEPRVRGACAHQFDVRATVSSPEDPAPFRHQRKPRFDTRMRRQLISGAPSSSTCVCGSGATRPLSTLSNVLLPAPLAPSSVRSRRARRSDRRRTTRGVYHSRRRRRATSSIVRPEVGGDHSGVGQDIDRFPSAMRTPAFITTQRSHNARIASITCSTSRIVSRSPRSDLSVRSRSCQFRRIQPASHSSSNNSFGASASARASSSRFWSM